MVDSPHCLFILLPVCRNVYMLGMSKRIYISHHTLHRASGSAPHVPGAEELERHRSSYEGYTGCPAYTGDMEWPGFLRQLERSDPGWSTRGLP